MPDRKTHEDFERQILKRSFPKIHMAKDQPGLMIGKILPKYAGPKHRLIGHRDPFFNLVVPVALYPKDPLRAIASAVLHDVLDYGHYKYTKRAKKRGANYAPSK